MNRPHNGYDYWLIRTGGPDVDQWPLRPSDTMLQAIEQATEQARHHQELIIPGLTAPRVGGGLAITRCLADVQAEPVRWLWPGRIARGKVTLICGDPGLGKSFCTLDIASRLSTGSAWPDGRLNSQGSVILLSAEDDAADTIKPRLDSMGADTKRIHILDAVAHVDRESGERSERVPTLADVAALADAIANIGDVHLVVIDPVSAYIGKVDSHKNAELRALLSPLAQLAAAYRVAVLAVSHLNKSAAAAIYRVQGSLGFIAASRAAWAVTKDKNDENRRLMVPIKNNLAKDIGGLAYRITGEAGRVEWEAEPINMSADEALAPDTDESRSEREEASDWLRDVLADGPKPARTMQTMAREAGLAWRTVRRAKDELGIRPAKTRFDGGWEWSLPSKVAKMSSVARQENVDSLDTFDKSGRLDDVSLCPACDGEGCAHCGDTGLRADH